MRTWILTFAVLLGAACTGDVPLEGARCPCIEGFVCCPALAQCVAETDVDVCPALLLSEVEPAEGPSVGGTQLTLRGLALPDGADLEVRVGGGLCAPVTPAGPDAVRCVVPPGSPGATWVDVEVRSPAGTARGLDGYRYVLPPFRDATTASVAAGQVASVGLGVGDLDRNGLADLVFGRFLDGEGTPEDRGLVLLNRGEGRFEDVTDPGWNGGLGPVREVIVADFSQDGWPDLLYSRQDFVPDNPEVHMLRNNVGDGTFGAFVTAVRNDAPGYLAGLTAVDLEGDGDLDVVACRSSTTQRADPIAVALVHTGADFLTLPLPVDAARIQPEVQNCRAVAVGDLDGDGVPEIVLAGHFISVLRRGEDGIWFDDSARHALPTDVEGGLAWVALVDFDHDGDLDVSVMGAERHGVRLYANAEGVLRRVPRLDEGDSNIQAIGTLSAATLRLGQGTGVWTDVDLDGDPDLFVPVPQEGEGRWPMLYRSRLAQGTRGYDPEPLVGLSPTVAPWVVRRLDVDGDGDEDLAMAVARPWPLHRRIFASSLAQNEGTRAGPVGWALRVRPRTDPDGDTADDIPEDDRAAFGVTVEVDLDGPLDAPDFAPGVGRRAVQALSSGDEAVVVLAVPAETEAVWVRTRFADGTVARRLVRRDASDVVLGDCREDCTWP